MGSISHYITPLVINSLGGHTNTHTYRCLHENNFEKPGVHWPVVGTPGLKYSMVLLCNVQIVLMRTCKTEKKGEILYIRVGTIKLLPVPSCLILHMSFMDLVVI